MRAGGRERSPVSGQVSGQVRGAPGSAARLESLQALRGLAACAVLGYHALVAVRDFSHGPLPVNIVTEVLRLGHFGVDFFFLLSGFIILHSHLGDTPGARSAGRYALKRALRVYPPYLPVSVAMLSVYAFWPGLSAASGAASPGPGLCSSLLLLPCERPPALAVAWTLIHEVVFYAIFLLFYVRRWLLAVATVAWMAGIVLAPIWWRADEVSMAVRVLLSPVNMQFAAGMACALVWRRLRPSPTMGRTLVASGVALLLLLAPGVAQQHAEVLALPFACLVLGGACLDTVRPSTARRAGRWLGDASYSLYLVHGPVISLTVRVVRALAGNTSWWPMLVAVCAASLAAAWCYHRAVERPLLRAARRRVSMLKG